MQRRWRERPRRWVRESSTVEDGRHADGGKDEPNDGSLRLPQHTYSVGIKGDEWRTTTSIQGRHHRPLRGYSRDACELNAGSEREWGGSGTYVGNAMQIQRGTDALASKRRQHLRCSSTDFVWGRRSPGRMQPLAHRIVMTSRESLDASCLPPCELSRANSRRVSTSRRIVQFYAHLVCGEVTGTHFLMGGLAVLFSSGRLCVGRIDAGGYERGGTWPSWLKRKEKQFNTCAWQRSRALSDHGIQTFG